MGISRATLIIGEVYPIKLESTPWKRSEKNTIDGKLMLNQDFREFIESLNDNQVLYLVVGGYAVALHGHPRYTKDIDIWIQLTPENIASVIKALDQFGFGSLNLGVKDFLEPDTIIQLGYPPRRIDILNTLSGVEFDPCYELREIVEIDGVVVNFMNLECLKINKLASGRAQDIADLENLGYG